MGTNKLTPGQNLMWESSRMMLPEHKAQIRAHQRKVQKRTKPLLDEQQISMFSQMISDAMNQNCSLKVQVFHPDHDHYITGKVQNVIPGKQLKLVSGEDSEWVDFAEITDVSIL